MNCKLPILFFMFLLFQMHAVAATLRQECLGPSVLGLRITLDSALQLMNNDKSLLPIREQDLSCVFVNTTLKLYPSVVDSQGLLLYQSPSPISVTVRAISPNKISEVLQPKNLDQYALSLDQILDLRASYDKGQTDWFAVSLTPQDYNFKFLPPLKHPLARTVSLEEALKMAKSGTALVADLRDRWSAKRKKLKKTITNPYDGKNQDFYRQPLRNMEVLRSGFVLKPIFMMADKKKSVVIIGRNPVTFDGYNAVTYFAAKGFSDVYWVAQGSEPHFKIAAEAP